MSRASLNSIAYREGLFTPAQAAACTGLSPAMQRNWRQAGHIAARTSEMALFSPRDLAAIRIMVVLRDVGLGPTLSRSIAEQAAPSVIWIALSDYPSTWIVAGDAAQATEYRKRLESDDSKLRSMAGLTGPAYTFGIAQAGKVELTSAINDDCFDADDEVESVVKLAAIARRIATSATQPLVTVIPPWVG
jgi:hypothetical protein